MTHLMTDEDIEHMDAHIDAAARGDAREALWHLDQSLQVEGTLTPHQLQELVSWGPGARMDVLPLVCGAGLSLDACGARPCTDDAVLQTMIVAYLDRPSRSPTTGVLP